MLLDVITELNIKQIHIVVQQTYFANLGPILSSLWGRGISVGVVSFPDLGGYVMPLGSSGDSFEATEGIDLNHLNYEPNNGYVDIAVLNDTQNVNKPNDVEGSLLNDTQNVNKPNDVEGSLLNDTQNVNKPNDVEGSLLNDTQNVNKPNDVDGPILNDTQNVNKPNDVDISVLNDTQGVNKPNDVDGFVLNDTQGVNKPNDVDGSVLNDTQNVNKPNDVDGFVLNDTQDVNKPNDVDESVLNDTQGVNKPNDVDISVLNATKNVNKPDVVSDLVKKNTQSIIQGVDTVGITHMVGKAARDLESTVKWLVASGKEITGLLVFGDEDWIFWVVSVIKTRKLLGPENILILLPTSGKISGPRLARQIRLGAKVIVLELKEDITRNPSDLGLRKARSRVCQGYIKHAVLLAGGQYAIQNVGCWASSGHKLLLNGPLLPAYGTLRGADVKVVIVKNFIEAIRVGPGGRFLVGYLGRVVNTLAEALQFRYSIMEGSSFGTLTPNGSFDGVVGHIERKEGDLGLASLSIAYHRKLAIDYTTWIMYHPTLFVTRAPRMFNDPLILFKIYTWQAWCAIAGFLIFAGSCLWLFWWSWDELVPEVTHPEHKKGCNGCANARQVRKSPGYAKAVSTILKSAIYQGTVHLPTTSSGRIICASSWLIVIIMYALYSGNLTAFLSIPRVDRPPSTVSQLVTRNWAFSLNKAFGSFDLVKETETKDYQTLYRRAEERGFIKENSGATANRDSSEMLVKNIAVVMGETGAFYNMNSNTYKDGRCKLTHGQEDIGKEYAGLALPKMSLLKPFFDKKLMWMRQMGIIQKHYKDSFGIKCFRGVKDSGERKPLALYQLEGVVYTWICGMGAAFASFVFEILVGRRRRATLHNGTSS
ncbi:uncharacterized protein [Palaemon carinicauda]|uniref:uncharacterized protein n=1 Tax=Palaemon carinicauda TaxID=392227 RepID=UPI0035B5A22F